MNQLGGIEIPDGVSWVESPGSIRWRSATRTDLLGAPVVFLGSAPVAITLQSDESSGWFTPETVSALLSLSEAAAHVLLEWTDIQRNISNQIAFDHENGPACVFVPLFPGAPYYTGTIRLVLLE